MALAISATYPVLVLTKVLPYHRSLVVLGSACSIAVVAMFGSPLLSAFWVIKTKDASALSLPFAATSFVNCLLWSAYASQRNDQFLLYPNIIGMIFSFTQVGLIVWCGGWRSEIDHVSKKVIEIGFGGLAKGINQRLKTKDCQEAEDGGEDGRIRIRLGNL